MNAFKRIMNTVFPHEEPWVAFWGLIGVIILISLCVYASTHTAPRTARDLEPVDHNRKITIYHKF